MNTTLQSCLKFLKKNKVKYKLRLLGGGAKKKKAKLDITDLDQEDESQNMINLNEMRSNRIETIMNSQATQEKPVDDMMETADIKRKEKKVPT